MGKKPVAMERPLADRLAQARAAGKSQQALEFAHQLYKQSHTPQNLVLLQQVTLERGRQLQLQGATRDAAAVFSNLLDLGGAPELLAEAATRLAACGAAARALQAAATMSDPQVRQHIVQNVADAAICKGPAGKSDLPSDLHAGFDAVLQAFSHYEAGRDDEARNAMQAIGLQSPFLEWKVLLRGLMAYQAGDDARALENWTRLDSHRRPFILCVAHRASIDPAFMQAQPGPTQLMLRTSLAKHQAGDVTAVLRELQPLLSNENLAPAFRKIEGILPTLKAAWPDMIRRLASCYFWAIVNHGQPEDIPRYQRVFGIPADDPHMYRLEALALEAHGMWPESHQLWQQFIAHVAKSPETWPGETGKRVQALVWSRMAENADSGGKHHPSENPFFDMFARGGPPLKPDAAACYEKAIALAPDRIEAYTALFDHYRAESNWAKAKKVGAELLSRFPDHADTLTGLGDLHMLTKAFAKAQEFFEKAIHANPLDENLRLRLAQTSFELGQKYTIDGKPDKARPQFEKSLSLVERGHLCIRCMWAAAEMRAKNTARADELITEAGKDADTRLAVRYALVSASVRVKLPTKEKKRFADELKSAFQQSPTPAEILELLATAAHQRIIFEDAFHGQKTQEKTILKFLDGIDLAAFDEKQMERLATGLQIMQARKPLLRCLNFARSRHLKNPYFRLVFVEYYLQDPSGPKTHLAREHLEQARTLVNAMPRGEQQLELLERMQAQDKLINEFNAMRPRFLDIMGQLEDEFLGDDGGDDEDW